MGKNPQKPDEFEGVDQSSDSPDLTSTIHLSALRSVRNQRDIEEIFSLLSAEERRVLAELPKNSSMFVVLAGPNKGERFLLDSDLTTVGRESASNIFLDDVTVSRKHAQIRRSEDGFIIEDLGSLNGSYLNARAVSRERLVVGDEVQIGKFRLTYFSGKGNS